MCLYVLFRLLLDLGAGSVCVYVQVCVCICVYVLSRRWDHELKRRLMSQDMEAQTPICSLPHSGGCLSPQNPILSANTHTYTHICIHRWGTAGRPRTQDCMCTSGRESTCLGKCKDREGEQREGSWGKGDRDSLWLDVFRSITLHPVGHHPAQTPRHDPETCHLSGDGETEFKRGNCETEAEWKAQREAGSETK